MNKSLNWTRKKTARRLALTFAQKRKNALAVAVVAGALSVFLAPGPYGSFCLVIGFTFLALLIGYSPASDGTGVFLDVCFVDAKKGNRL